MEFTTFLNSTVSSLIIAAVLAGVAFFLVRARTGSWRLLMERIWRIAAGKSDISDDRINEWTRELHEVERFRFMYGFKVETVQEVHELINWIRSCRIRFREACKAAHWIAVDKSITLYQPSSRFYKKGIAALAALYFAMAAPLMIGSSGWELLRIKETGTWFVTDGVRAMSFGWKVKKGVCGPAQWVAASTEKAKHDIEIVCKGIVGGSLAKFVDESRSKTKWIWIGIAVPIFLALVKVCKDLWSAVAARRIAKELEEKNMIVRLADFPPAAHGGKLR
ncbi:DUF6216 family protein [Cupriavidus sp. HPC(L)]|uniref:DUF6216 family protein n=1 Tax=Cupriavidus sp. HPC(L) TaxID=1217418 RepID=UPI0012ED65F0|nr:DUF6216 family protein [Cupriavidus sp. HPC(L)]